jgi:hypothetical protein
MRSHSSFYVSHDGKRLLLGSFLPAGSHQGVVGVWSAEFETDTLNVDGSVKEQVSVGKDTWTFAADGTATDTLTTTVSRTVSGTWKFDTGTQQVAVQVSGGSPAASALTLVDDAALGAPVLQRQ